MSSCDLRFLSPDFSPVQLTFELLGVKPCARQELCQLVPPVVQDGLRASWITNCTFINWKTHSASGSFFSLQTPHTTEQVNRNQGRHTATNQKERFQCGYCFKCPRWHCSSVRFGTLDTTPLSRCLNWETRFQVPNTQPSLKGCWNNSKLLWYTNHLVTKCQKHFQKFSSQTGSRPNANNQLAGVTSLPNV